MLLADVLSWADAVFQRVSVYVNAFVIALVILLSGFILGRLVDRLLYKLFSKVGFDGRMTRFFGARRNYSRATRVTLVYAIYVATVYLALQRLRVDQWALLFVLTVFSVIIVVSLVFASIEIIPNLLALGKLRKRRVTAGCSVEIHDPSGNVVGKVEKVTLTEVQIKRKNGDVVFYPNAALLRTKFIRKK